MSKMMVFGFLRSWTRSIQDPEKSVNTARLSSVGGHSVSKRPI